MLQRSFGNAAVAELVRRSQAVAPPKPDPSPSPLAGEGRGGGAAGGLCGVVAGPPPCPPGDGEGENARSSLTRGEADGSGLGGATAWLRRTSSATAALPNDRCSISRLLGESARATGGGGAGFRGSSGGGALTSSRRSAFELSGVCSGPDSSVSGAGASTSLTARERASTPAGSTARSGRAASPIPVSGFSIRPADRQGKPCTAILSGKPGCPKGWTKVPSTDRGEGRRSSRSPLWVSYRCTPVSSNVRLCVQGVQPARARLRSLCSKCSGRSAMPASPPF